MQTEGYALWDVLSDANVLLRKIVALSSVRGLAAVTFHVMRNASLGTAPLLWALGD